MADEVIYVDEQATGDNNGTTWEHARTDIQDALDNVTDGNDTDIFVRNTQTIAATKDVDVAGGSAANNKWLKIIGCDAAGDELTLGNYVLFDALGADLSGGPVVKIVDYDNIQFRNIYTKNDASPASGEHGFAVVNGSTHYNYSFRNCKVTDADDGWNGNTNARSFLVADCVCDVTGDGVYGNSYGVLVLNSDIKAAGDYGIYLYAYPVGTFGNIIRDASTGVRFASLGIGACAHNTMHNIGVNGIWVSGTSANANIFNNIIWVATVGADYALYRTAHSIAYEDYNYTNATTNGLLTGSNSLNSRSDAQIAFMDAANGDFRLKPSSIALNTGKPVLGNGLTDQGFTNIGAWQRKSFIDLCVY